MKNCNCLQEYNEKLRKKTDDPEGYLNEIMSFESGQINGFIAIPFYFRKKNKKGLLNQKRIAMNVKCSYCPFCGVEIRTKG